MKLVDSSSDKPADRLPADPEEARREVLRALYYIPVPTTEVALLEDRYPGRQPKLRDKDEAPR